MVKSPERRGVRLTLRLPDGLRKALEDAALADQRSLSDWIVVTLSKAVGYKTPIKDLLGVKSSSKK